MPQLGIQHTYFQLFLLSAHSEEKALLFALIGNGLIRDWNGLYQRLHAHERAYKIYRPESLAY